MADLSDLFPDISDQQVYDQLIADLPFLSGGKVFNTREGSALHGLLSSYVVDRRRLMGYQEEALRQTFLLYATGEFLDARAGEIGIVRAAAVASGVTLSFTGTDGTIIPAASRFSTEGDPVSGDEGVTFSTEIDVTIAGGVASVLARSETPGVAGNVGADTVVLVSESPAGVVSVTNVDPATGGLDEQDDDSLRTQALQKISVFPEGGNANTFKSAALERPEVGVVDVVDRWLGAGTGLVVVGGSTTPHVPPATVNLLQEDFDPSIKPLAHFETPEVWSDGDNYTSNPIEGAGSRELTPAISSTETMHIDFSTPENLAAWDDATDEIWVFLRRVSASGTLGNFLIIFYNPLGEGTGKVTATISAATVNALSNITTRALLAVPLSSFSTTGTFSWGNVGGVKFSLTATGTGAAEMVIDGLRIRRAAGGFPAGRAALGVQIMVRSARIFEVGTTAGVTLRSGVSISDVRSYIEAGLDALFASIPPGGSVYLKDVENVIHDAPGVLDFINVQINSGTSNLTLDSDQRPVRSSLGLA